MTDRIKNLLVNLLLISVSLAVGLILLELGVRVFGLYRFPSEDFVEPHPELGWAHIPNKEGFLSVGKNRIHVRINSKGLRDREYAYEKKGGIYRILLLGDSFTEAFQVPLESTFAKLLESKLNAKNGGFEVINSGFAGVGTDWELLFYKREGHKYNPDLVIVGFFYNDVYDSYRSKDILESRESLLAYEDKGLVVRLKKLLARRSCAYNYIGAMLPIYAPRLARLLMDSGLLSFQPVDAGQEPEQLHWLVLSIEYPPVWRQAWEITRVLFTELKKEVEGRGARLAVVSIPFKEQVYDKLWKSQLEVPGMKSSEWELDKPDKMLAKILKEADIPLLTLLPHFRKAAADALLYVPVDGHLNAEGHRLTAECIYEWLVAESIVPIETESRTIKASM